MKTKPKQSKSSQIPNGVPKIWKDQPENVRQYNQG